MVPDRGGVQSYGRAALRQLTKHGRTFDACELGPQAVVGSQTEAQMRVSPSSHVELVSALEDLWIAIRRPDQQEGDAAGTKRLGAQGERLDDAPRTALNR